MPPITGGLLPAQTPGAPLRLTPKGIRDIVVRRAAEVGLAVRVRGTHVIRHTLAAVS